MIRKLGFVAVLAALAALPAPAEAKTFKVTQTGDPPPGSCGPRCSLREAVLAANGRPGADAVALKARRYRLTIPGSCVPGNCGEDLAEGGDLDILGDLTIRGAGRTRTTIDGEWNGSPDRLIDVPPTSEIDLTLRGLTLRDGQDPVDDASTGDGAALLFTAAGNRLALNDVRVTSNQASSAAVYNEGRARFERVRFDHNQSSGDASALYDAPSGRTVLREVRFTRNDGFQGAMEEAGRVSMRNVTFDRNTADGIGAGLSIYGEETSRLANVTFSANSTAFEGGGLWAGPSPGGSVLVNNATITRNVADANADTSGGGGGIFRDTGVVRVQNSIIAGNFDRGGENPDCLATTESAFISNGFNLLGSDTCSAVAGPGDRTGVSNPRLKPLRRNGAFTPTHALRKRSKARNRGSRKRPGSGGRACVKRDQRGVKRPQGRRCDIGAYELKQKRRR